MRYIFLVRCTPCRRTLLRGVMLRRSKAAVEAQLALPPCERIDRPVQLSGVERTFYDVLKVGGRRGASSCVWESNGVFLGCSGMLAGTWRQALYTT